jgi:hypothetical protein
MISGICVVCQFQGARVQHQVMGQFEELSMCHWHLLDARNGMLAAGLLHGVHLVMRPVKAVESKSKGEVPEPKKLRVALPRSDKTRKILELLKAGEKQSVICKQLNLSHSYVSRLSRECAEATKCSTE